MFMPPGGKTNSVKLVSSDDRCLLWNKYSETAHELVFKNVKADPDFKTIWDNKEDPVKNIVGGTDGRFVIATAKTAYMLKGDKLDEIVIPGERTGGGSCLWALGDGWEIFFGEEKIWGRGKSAYGQAASS